jgi:hypothetical protein
MLQKTWEEYFCNLWVRLFYTHLSFFTLYIHI